jgi:uncharacterized protein (TIGR02996 family)
MTDHPEYVGLLRDILHSPGEDGPRLIMADWLDDNGFHARADLIRVQIAISRCDDPLSVNCKNHGHREGHVPFGGKPNCCSPEFARLRARERTLLEDNIRTLSQPICLATSCYSGRLSALGPPPYVLLDRPDPPPGGPLYTIGTATFTRGFVSAVEMCMDDFMAHASNIFRAEPVTDVVIGDVCPLELATGEAGDSWGGWCTWSRKEVVFGWSPEGDSTNILPDMIFGLLTSGKVAGLSKIRGTLYYPSAKAAMADVSAACVTHGRSFLPS